MASAIPSLLVAYEGDTGLMGFTSTSQGFSQLTCNVTSNSITGNSTVNLSHHMLRLHRIAELLGLEKPNIITAFELIKHNQLEACNGKQAT